MLPGRSILRRQLTPERVRFLKFAFVGATGVLVNEAVLWLCYRHLLAGLTAPTGEAFARLLAFGGAATDSPFGGALAVGAFEQLVPDSFHAVARLLGGNRLTWSGIAAIGVAILTNFLLNDAWTWRDRRKARGGAGFLVRLGQYYLVASVAGVVQWTTLKLLTESVGLHYLLSNLLGVIAGLAINFVVNNLWTFRDRGPRPSAPP
jgi:putative flippase GtrA